MRERVAVVIPTYNRADRIVGTIESVLAQGDALGRVIVVDDGSTDDTKTRVAPLASRITFVTKENGERGAARNAGARLADEPYLCFLDSDDRLLLGHLQAAVAAFAAHRDAAAVYSDVMMEGDDGRIVGQRRGARVPGFRGGEPVTSLIANYDNCLLAQGATCYRSEAFAALGGFREERALAGSEDFELNVRLLSRAPYAPTGSLTFAYRMHGGNTFANVAQSTRCIRASVEFIEQDGDLARFSPLFPRMRAFAELQLAAAHLAAADFAGCRDRLADAFAQSAEVVASSRFAGIAARCVIGRAGNQTLRRLKRFLRAYS
jgi:glycosyltransferase involved in cell wall biosynthesis